MDTLLDDPRTMIRILLADDHAIVRRGFRALIEEEHDLLIVAECGTADEARIAMDEHKPDVMVLDLSMPGGGLSLVPESGRAQGRTKLLVLSMHDREPYISEALRRGVHGYVTKGAATDELVTAVRAVCAGQTYLSSDLERVHATPVSSVSPLTEREFEIFLMLARGDTPKQVAHQLGISIKTAYLHRATLREKLGARRDLDLHRIALERGLLS